MTHEEIVSSWGEHITVANNVMRIVHDNMKTVEFYAVSYQDESLICKFNGYWISKQTNDIIVNDILKIKKEDLTNWKIVK